MGNKKTVMACRVTPDPMGPQVEGIMEVREFGTRTRDLLAWSDWLTEAGITQVAMESTGEYWTPVYHLLEGTCTVFLVNAAHVKNVPGRKTDRPMRAGWPHGGGMAGGKRALFLPWSSAIWPGPDTVPHEGGAGTDPADQSGARGPGTGHHPAGLRGDRPHGGLGRAIWAALIDGRAIQPPWRSWPRAACAARCRCWSRRDRLVRDHQPAVVGAAGRPIDFLDEPLEALRTAITHLLTDLSAAPTPPRPRRRGSRRREERVGVDRPDILLT